MAKNKRSGDGQITAGGLFKVFNAGYNDGGKGRKKDLPVDENKLAKEYVEQLQESYLAGYKRGVKDRKEGTYNENNNAEAWRRFLNKLP